MWSSPRSLGAAAQEVTLRQAGQSKVMAVLCRNRRALMATAALEQGGHGIARGAGCVATLVLWSA